MQFFRSNTIMTLKQRHDHHQCYLQTVGAQQRLPPCKNGINGSQKCTHAYYVYNDIYRGLGLWSSQTPHWNSSLEKLITQ